MSDPFQADLTLASVDELVEELRKRFDAVLVVGEKRVRASGPSDVETQVAYGGSTAHAIGLAVYAQGRIYALKFGELEENDE
ncbi:MAG: hypothetical protein EBR82_48775 [Caulobacteraceae bacterium]|nr:hypothetical protein [Caulobacteraceae bacterium]